LGYNRNRETEEKKSSETAKKIRLSPPHKKTQHNPQWLFPLQAQEARWKLTE